MRTHLVSLAISLLLSGCASAPPRAESDPVSIGDWCEQIGKATCNALADRCFNGMDGVASGCLESFGPNCLAGRAAADQSGRNFGDLQRCLASFKGQSCGGLGAAVGSGSFGALCAATR